MKSDFSTDIGIFFLKILARLPFRFLYVLSDIFYVLIFYIVKYRKNVVFENLKNSFPEKTTEELKNIQKKFYRHFCDLTLETIKMPAMKKADYEKRMEIRDVDLLDSFFEKGKSIVVLTMHYNNWEWTAYFPSVIKHHGMGVYKPLHNKKFDSFMNNSRESNGAEMISDKNTLRRIIKANQNNEKIVLWLAGDQTPPEFHTRWLTFFNQETLFYPGTASIAKRFDFPVLFQKVEKTERGKYRVSFEVLVENPKEWDENEILKIYIKKMEELIYEAPEYYLWSHKRWKHKRPENVPLF